jgi:hypothetical protein
MDERSVLGRSRANVSALGTLRASVQLSCSERDRSLPPKLYVNGPFTLSGSRSARLFTRAEAFVPVAPLRQHEDGLANTSPRFDRLSVLLRTSFARHSGYAGRQEFHKRAQAYLPKTSPTGPTRSTSIAISQIAGIGLNTLGAIWIDPTLGDTVDQSRRIRHAGNFARRRRRTVGRRWSYPPSAARANFTSSYLP